MTMDFSNLFSNPTVIWFIVGLILILLELVVPGFVIIFFGFGSWITALCCLIFGIHLELQFVIFTLTSVVILLIFRRYLKGNFFIDNKESVETLEDEFMNRTAVVESDIRKGYAGKVSFKGTTWTATSDTNISKGQLVKIIGKESISLIVKPVTE